MQTSYSLICIQKVHVAFEMSELLSETEPTVCLTSVNAQGLVEITGSLCLTPAILVPIFLKFQLISY